MFRFEKGANIVVRKRGSTNCMEVKILAKAPNMIKVKVLSDGWFKRGNIEILTDGEWYVVSRMEEAKSNDTK